MAKKDSLRNSPKRERVLSVVKYKCEKNSACKRFSKHLHLSLCTINLSCLNRTADVSPRAPQLIGFYSQGICCDNTATADEQRGMKSCGGI